MFAINREKFSSKLPPNRYELENKNKLIIELSAKLDKQHQQVKTLKQLYSQQLIEQRKQLSEEISFIFRYAPIEYGRVCEDILWKRNYYDCVKVFKKYRRQLTTKSNNDNNIETISLLRSHLLSGIGHYHSLLISFREGFNLECLDQLIFLPISSNHIQNHHYLNNSPFKLIKQQHPNLNDSANDQTMTSLKLNNFDDNNNIYEDNDETALIFDYEYICDEKFKETLMYLIYRFYICIGDLARYYADFFPSINDSTIVEKFDDQNFKIASLYYRFASLMQPQLGMPYNQLGTLHTNSFYGLNSIYFYFRCLNSKKKFIGIKENLKHTFSFVAKSYAYDINEDSKDRLKNVNGFIGHNSSILMEKNFQNDEELVRSTINRFIDIFSQLFDLIDEIENKEQTIMVSKLFRKIDDVLILFRNALNIVDTVSSSNKKMSHLKPDKLLASNIFEIISIIVILIDQLKMSMKKNEINVNLAAITSDIIESENFDGSLNIRSNLILYISYYFLFQVITMVIHRESELLKKMLYASQNLIDDDSTISQQVLKKQKKNMKPNSISKQSLRKHYQSTQSFSSDYGDCPNNNDETTMAELKSRVIKTIQDILDSSENEDEDDADDNEVEELIMLDTIEDIDCEYKTQKNGTNNCTFPLSSDSRTFDQILAFLYAESFTSIIKFFCDYLQSNGDFIEILQNMSILVEYFEQFFNYLNLISDFDLRLIRNFKSYLEHEFQKNNAKKQMAKIHELIDLFNYINQLSNYTLKDFKQSSPLSSEMAFMNLTEELSNFYRSLFNCQDDWNLMNLKNELTIEKSCYLSMKSMLILGIKLALLSLENGNFKLIATDYNLVTIHDIKQNKHVKFIFETLQPFKSKSILKNDHYSTIIFKARDKCKQLIQFDLNDNDDEMENVCDNITNDNDENKETSSKKMQPIDRTNVNNNFHEPMKSLIDFEKLPHLLIDPFVYLENLEQIKQIVLQKKAFVIVPKLVTDFLNNLKSKNIKSAIEASVFLHDEFFRGSRMIRFIRDEDRLELEMLNYPRKNVWCRNMMNNDNENVDDNVNVNVTNSDDRKINCKKLQDFALFYELLEHCHHLLTHKILKHFKHNDNEQQQQLTLITTNTNLNRWPSNASTSIAQACGIEIDTMDSYLIKQNIKNNNYKKYRMNRKFDRHNKTLSSSNINSNSNNGIPPQKSSNAHFRPIQNMANNTNNVAGTSSMHQHR